VELYANREESSNYRGLLIAGEQRLELSPIGYSHDLPSIEAFPFRGLRFDPHGDEVLVGAIGSQFLGYQYFGTSQSGEAWFAFHQWGAPEAADLDGNGVMELLLQ